jgi:hypothetical protein
MLQFCPQRLPYAASPGAFVYKRGKISQFFTLAGGSSEWLGRGLGSQGDLAANLLSAASLSSLSTLSLVIGFCKFFVTGRRLQAGGPFA